MSLMIHRGKIQSSNRAGKAHEHGDGFVSDRAGPVDVESFEIGHKPDLSTRVHFDAERVRVDDDGSAVEDQIGSA